MLVLDPILAHRYLFLWFRGHFSFAIFLLFLLICLYTDHRLLRITHSARNGEQRPYIMPCTQTTQTNHCSRVGFRGQHATSSRRSQMDWNGLLNVLETFTAIYFPSNFQSSFGHLTNSFTLFQINPFFQHSKRRTFWLVNPGLLPSNLRSRFRFTHTATALAHAQVVQMV